MNQCLRTTHMLCASKPEDPAHFICKCPALSSFRDFSSFSPDLQSLFYSDPSAFVPVVLGLIWLCDEDLQHSIILFLNTLRLARISLCPLNGILCYCGGYKEEEEESQLSPRIEKLQEQEVKSQGQKHCSTERLLYRLEKFLSEPMRRSGPPDYLASWFSHLCSG